MRTTSRLSPWCARHGRDDCLHSAGLCAMVSSWLPGSGMGTSCHGTWGRLYWRRVWRLLFIQGADFVEGDTVLTKDGHLVLRHEVIARCCSAFAPYATGAMRWCYCSDSGDIHSFSSSPT